VSGLLSAAERELQEAARHIREQRQRIDLVFVCVFLVLLAGMASWMAWVASHRRFPMQRAVDRLDAIEARLDGLGAPLCVQQRLNREAAHAAYTVKNAEPLASCPHCSTTDEHVDEEGWRWCACCRLSLGPRKP
jgi:hypothetical protein